MTTDGSLPSSAFRAPPTPGPARRSRRGTLALRPHARGARFARPVHLGPRGDPRAVSLRARPGRMADDPTPRGLRARAPVRWGVATLGRLLVLEGGDLRVRARRGLGQLLAGPPRVDAPRGLATRRQCRPERADRLGNCLRRGGDRPVPAGDPGLRPGCRRADRPVHHHRARGAVPVRAVHRGALPGLLRMGDPRRPRADVDPRRDRRSAGRPDADPGRVPRPPDRLGSLGRVARAEGGDWAGSCRRRRRSWRPRPR